MKMVVSRCKARNGCGRVTYILSPEGFCWQDNLNGVYRCPICRNDCDMATTPVEIDPPRIHIKEGDKTAIIANLAKPTKQRENISQRQLLSLGLRDNDIRERTPEEQEEPAIDGVVVPRKESPCSKYEAEVSKYLGVPEENTG